MGEEEKREYNLAVLIILLILCWPAALIYYFTRPKVKSKPMRICPGCGRQIPVEYQVCPYCGRSVTFTPPPPTPAATAAPSVGGRFCPHCGAQVSQTARFCPTCGKQLP